MTRSRRYRKFRFRTHDKSGCYWRRSRFRLIVVALVAVFVVLVIAYVYRFAESQRYTVVGKPSISAQFINSVLAWYHSPAAGKGQVLYDDGVKYGIDPAYALAFFMHESKFGTTGVATVTHSLGNNRATAGHTQYQGYRMYGTWEEGFEDWYRLIAKQYVAQWGLWTVDQIIPVYAPASDDNDVAAYIAAVKQAVDTWRSGSVEV